MRYRRLERALLRAFGILALLFVLALSEAAGRSLPSLIERAAQLVARSLALPGYAVGQVLQHTIGWPQTDFDGLAFTLHSPTGIWFLCLLSFPLYSAAFLSLDRRRAEAPEDGEPLTRRQLLARAAVAGVAAAGLYGCKLEPGWVEVVRHPLALRGLPRELDGLRMAMLTDLHRGPYTSLEFLIQVVDRTNSLEPDLVLLPGDFVFHSPEHFDEAAEAVARLRAPCIGTLGNHDHWQGADRAREILARAGVRLIDNTRLFVTARRELAEDGGGLCIAGVGDLWEDATDIEVALDGVPEPMPRVLLSHNPDFAEEPHAREFAGRVDVMLSGHTHGGQVRLPLLGAPILPSRYGQKYASGWVQGPKWPVYVSRGIGTTILPVRFGARPEITVFTLRRS